MSLRDSARLANQIGPYARALAICAGLVAAGRTGGQTVTPHIDPAEPAGERPYEMVWSNRVETAAPTLAFDNLDGWKMQVSGGAEAALRLTRAQNVWNRPVAGLRYRSDGKAGANPSIVLVPPAPISVPGGATCAEMWIYGNRWDWENPPDTPAVAITLHLLDGSGTPSTLTVDRVRWKEWWLLHRQLPAGLKAPVRLESIEISGGRQTEWREIFLDSLRFYAESLAPLKFPARPRRNLTLFSGESPGANTAPGILPFPTREETILPAHQGAGRNSVRHAANGDFEFAYEGPDGGLTYHFRATLGLGGLEAKLPAPMRLMDGAQVRGVTGSPAWKLESAGLDSGVVTARYAGGTTLRLQISDRSLIVDVINRTGNVSELTFGQITGVIQPRTIYVPPITYGGTNPVVLCSRINGTERSIFTSLWPDWYRSNASEFYAADYASGTVARINGGIRYNPRTDGKRNPLFERIFITVSPHFEETLPTVPNPVGLHAAQAVDRLWQESWGPDDYAKQMKRSEMLRAYGIDKLIQCNHEITWRDGGESFTLRTRSAPKKGGDGALQKYVAHQRGLGWMSGLYTNYTDFSPVNAHWSPDYVQRESGGEWRSAWPRCWALKPLAAVWLDSQLAPVVQRKFGSNSAYTDVHTAVAPWGYCDYDARLPGAGTFAQTFYAYGELLRNDSRVYGGPIFSEGTYQWLYAGLADGNYGHTYNGHHLATDPLLPVFDLREIHSKECDIGVSWTGFFCDAISNWNTPENKDRAIDRFLLATLAYGHIGWLVEEEHGIERTCRSYYMLQQVQGRYGLRKPSRMAYWDGSRLRSVSDAIALDLPRTRRQLYVEYPPHPTLSPPRGEGRVRGGLCLWLNDHPSESWTVRAGGRMVTLPPAGWMAWSPGTGSDAGVFSYSGEAPGGRADYLRSTAYTYVGGRGKWVEEAEGATDGSLAIYPNGRNALRIIHISGDKPFVIRRPYGVTGALAGCAVFGVDGKPLGNPKVWDSGSETRIMPVAGGVRYQLRFAGGQSWYVVPGANAAPPGGTVRLAVMGAGGVRWTAQGGRIEGQMLRIPPDARIGSEIVVRAERGGDRREAVIRVCAPVEWGWQAAASADGTKLTLLPRWQIGSLALRKVTVELDPSPGWTVEPHRFELAVPRARAAFALPSALPVEVRSGAPVGTEGELRVHLAGMEAQPPFVLKLKRVAESPILYDLRSLPFQWSIARRGQKETPETGGSGAVCAPDDAMSVGGVVRKGLFMHPPYMSGVGYTVADFGPVDLPASSCRFEAEAGLRDGGDPSDGVVYRVEVVNSQGHRTLAGERLGVQKAWRKLAADLSPWRGQRVRLRLIADVGPNDNSSADWACWGEPGIFRTEPVTVTQVLSGAR